MSSIFDIGRKLPKALRKQKVFTIYRHLDHPLRGMSKPPSAAGVYRKKNILMSASALCLHVGMSTCFASSFVRQSVASAHLSVRLMIVYHCARRFIFRPSICLIFRPSVCLSVCMFTCIHVETNVLVYELWTSKIELT